MFELDETLKSRNKSAEIEQLALSQPAAGAIEASTRQQAAARAWPCCWCARDIVGNEPFAVVLPDELVLNSRAA